ncbi:MAG: DUF1573 domain-containing protein [Phycisphaerales bacterium]|nr:MAG: DUF1573 domain-containing protein [Phycisphaerales bacterium]
MRILSTAALFFLLAGVAIAVAWNSLKTGKPRICVQQPVVDLGVIDSTIYDTKAGFEIFNKGKAPLILERIKASCSCLQPQLNRSNLPPGGKATLTVNVSPPLTPGKWRDSILIYSNDPHNEVTALTVKAFIEPRCSVVPDSIFINRLHRGLSEEVELTISGVPGNSSFRVLDISANTDAVMLSKIYDAGVVEGAGRRVWKVYLIVKSRGLASWRDKVGISTTDPKMPSIEVPIVVQEIEDVEFEPRIIALANAVGDVNGSTVEIVSTNDAAALECIGLESPDWVDVERAESEKGTSDRLCFRVTAGNAAGERIHKGEIRIFIKGRANAIRIPVFLFSSDP